MAIAVGDTLTIHVVVKEIVPGTHPTICLAPGSDHSFSWWVPLSMIQDSIVASPFRHEPATAAKVAKVAKLAKISTSTFTADELVALLLKRLAAHASTPAAVLPMDYGRIEELCWLIRWVMSDGALPAS